MTRKIPFEGIENFRDFGDYAGHGGRRLRKGRLYRSAAHGQATDADLEVLTALGIAAVVDLRRPGERTRDPSRLPPQFMVIVSEAAEAEGEDSWHTHIRESDLSEAAFRDYLFDYYRRAPFDPRHIDLFRRYFHLLAEIDGGILIHCAAGKDRTGLLAALTHHATGVDEADIVADYLLTNEPERFARRLPQFRELVEAQTGKTPSDEAMRIAMGVDAAYLAAAFEAIRQRFGGVDAYLEQALGVDGRLRELLHDRLLH